jgi:hypothetical protein
METVELERRGTVAYQIADDGPETIALVNGTILARPCGAVLDFGLFFLGNA